MTVIEKKKLKRANTPHSPSRSKEKGPKEQAAASEKAKKGKAASSSKKKNENRKSESKSMLKSGKKKNKHSKISQLFFDALFYVALLTIILTAVFFAFSNNQDKTLFGYRIFGVLTNSMAPNEQDKQTDGFRAGDVIIVRDIAGDMAEEGDVITYRPSVDSDAFLTHRVIEKQSKSDVGKGTYYITKGDNNASEDVPVSAEQVVAKKRWIIPKIGSVLKFIRNHFIVSAIFLVSVFGFVLVIRMYFFTEEPVKSKQVRKGQHTQKKKRAPNTQKKHKKRYLPQ